MRSGYADRAYPWGDTISPTNANYNNAVGQPTAAGAYPTNTYGLCDIAGSVWEWCGDWYETVLAGSVTNPVGPALGAYKVTRGGSWISTYKRLRCASRNSQTPSAAYVDLGFRCTLSVGSGAGNGSDEDLNGNGIPDWWEMWYCGTDIGQGGAVDASLDPDHDGLNNLEEYVADTDPTEGASVFAITAAETVPLGFAVWWSSQTGRTYSVERADNLSTSFVTIATNLLATTPDNVYTNLTGGKPVYMYRVKTQR